MFNVFTNAFSLFTYCALLLLLQALTEEKRQREKEFYESLFRADNSLNTQLKTSEEGK
jgi:hypothetical protein